MMMKEMFHRFMFFLLFVLLVIVITAAYDWVQSLLIGSPYEHPGADAVKVFQMNTDLDSYSIPDRLLLFFRYGE
ncbi:DUF4227 family protein [Paenibacillus camelliae]|uniref:DUF4227 family protein n=1 Tax=Paenibacillus camelliae TaxID=512410 RepID=UPI00203D60EA|nr:DUF4227 family protein [Paenibacillus camelliae]MCM3633131.1 YqzK family protein [Paenibacillus camelliae]